MRGCGSQNAWVRQRLRRQGAPTSGIEHVHREELVANRSPAIVVIDDHGQPQPDEQTGAGPLRVVVFGGAALLILFGWLHLILSLQIASTGRQIQVMQQELERSQRDNRALVRAIAEAEAQQNMAVRATVLGYGPQTPIYLPLTQPITAALTSGPEHPAGKGQAATGPAAGSNPAAEFLLHGAQPNWPSASAP